MTPPNDQYDIEENDIGKARLKTLKLMIIHGQEENKKQHDEIARLLAQVSTWQKEQGDRIAKVEGEIPKLVNRMRFWLWFSAKPVRLVVFVVSIAVAVKIISWDKAWDLGEKIIKLL